MGRPLLLDLFCGAGGAAVGYHRVGFDVVGVDIRPQPRYPFRFIQADALTFPLAGYDAIHASPPCQFATRARHIRAGAHPDLLTPMRERLRQLDIPWVLENVSGAPMGQFIQLCGTLFGLRIYRHRQFECSHLLLAPRCHHPAALGPDYVCVYGHQVRGRQTGRYGNAYAHLPVEAGRAAMGIDWMTGVELSQAIPPAYTEWIGRRLASYIAAGAGGAARE